MYALINEQIEVFATFTKNEAEPIAFTWKNRDYQIDSIDFAHISKKGAIKLFHFAVSTAGANYKITFDPINMAWTLDEIFTEKAMTETQSLNDGRKNDYKRHPKKFNNAY